MESFYFEEEIDNIDEDGLSDQSEKLLGTDPNNFTDQKIFDEILSKFDEVFYKDLEKTIISRLAYNWRDSTFMITWNPEENKYIFSVVYIGPQGQVETYASKSDENPHDFSKYIPETERIYPNNDDPKTYFEETIKPLLCEANFPLLDCEDDSAHTVPTNVRAQIE